MHKLNLRHEPLPMVALGFDDLASLRSIICASITYTRRATRRAKGRDDLLRLLESVYVRLRNIPVNIVNVTIPLSVMEIGAVNIALLGFIAFVRARVAPSRERDVTLQDVERLRQALTRML